MRYSTVPAINLEQHVARNAELIAQLPEPKGSALTWNPSTLKYDIDEDNLDLFHEMFETFN